MIDDSKEGFVHVDLFANDPVLVFAQNNDAIVYNGKMFK